jgi:hypothetical protein
MPERHITASDLPGRPGDVHPQRRPGDVHPQKRSNFRSVQTAEPALLVVMRPDRGEKAGSALAKMYVEAERSKSRMAVAADRWLEEILQMTDQSASSDGEGEEFGKRRRAVIRR